MNLKHGLVCLPFVLTLFAGCGQESDTAASSQAKAAADDASASSAGDAHLGAPKRKSGWWEFTSGTRSGGQGLCVTDATEAVFSAFDQITQASLLGYTCSKTDFHRSGAGWAFDIACDTGIPASVGGGIMTSTGTISGNINTAYEIQMTATQAGEKSNATIKATWKGACPAGRKAGDLVVGNTVVSVLD